MHSKRSSGLKEQQPAETSNGRVSRRNQLAVANQSTSSFDVFEDRGGGDGSSGSCKPSAGKALEPVSIRLASDFELEFV